MSEGMAVTTAIETGRGTETEVEIETVEEMTRIEIEIVTVTVTVTEIVTVTVIEIVTVTDLGKSNGTGPRHSEAGICAISAISGINVIYETATTSVI